MFRLRHLRVLALSSCAALLLGALAPAAHAHPDEAVDAPAAELSGTVRAAADDRPLARVEVRVSGAHTLTDAAGRWALDVPDGTHVVQVAPDPGPVAGPVEWFPEYYPDADSPEQAIAVTVRDGAPVEGLDVALDPAGRISGEVNGGWPPNAPPRAPRTDLAPGWELYTPQGSLAQVHPSPGAGSNDFSLLVRPGTYRLLMSGTTTDGRARRYLPQWYSADDYGTDTIESAATITVAAGEAVEGVDTEVAYGLWPVNATYPQVLGTQRVGQRVRVTRGEYNLTTDIRHVYLWQRDGRTVGTRPTYRLRRADVGGDLTVTVSVSTRGHAMSSTQGVTAQQRQRRARRR
ncbi:peptidase associated/transthyretin-like domain-containing protein [Nocardioides pacificus]